MQFKDLLGGLMPTRTRRRRMTVGQARDAPRRRRGHPARRHGRRCATERHQRVEQSGIVFVDEIDKVAGGRVGRKCGPRRLA